MKTHLFERLYLCLEAVDKNVEFLAHARGGRCLSVHSGTQFTCFTGTRGQILTVVGDAACACVRERVRFSVFTGFTSTKVQILTGVGDAACACVRERVSICASVL